MRRIIAIIALLAAVVGCGDNDGPAAVTASEPTGGTAPEQPTMVSSVHTVPDRRLHVSWDGRTPADQQAAAIADALADHGMALPLPGPDADAVEGSVMLIGYLDPASGAVAGTVQASVTVILSEDHTRQIVVTTPFSLPECDGDAPALTVRGHQGCGIVDRFGPHLWWTEGGHRFEAYYPDDMSLEAALDDLARWELVP